jgi:peptide/nickel transport system substrate-binding protein
LLDALTYLYIFPQHALASIAPKDLVKSSWWSTNPIGTGPFKWGKYVTDQYVELDAYDGYWRGRPKLDKLIDRNFTAAGSAVIALKSGDIQFTYTTPDEQASLKSDTSLTIIPGPSQVVNYLGFNLADKRFQDVRVRQAFMYAIDRQAIVDQLYKGAAQVAQCAYNNKTYIPADLTNYSADVAKAKSLLQQANWDSIKGQPIEILTYYGDQLSTNVLATIQQMLAQVGIDVKPRAVDVPTYNQTLSSKNFTMMFAGLGNGPDPDSVSTLYTSGGTLAKDFGINFPDLDKAFQAGQVEADTSKRPSLYQNACSVINQQLPNAPMWVQTRYGAVSNKIGNFIWTPSPGGGRYYDAAETWTISQ